MEKIERRAIERAIKVSPKQKEEKKFNFSTKKSQATSLLILNQTSILFTHFGLIASFISFTVIYFFRTSFIS